MEVGIERSEDVELTARSEETVRFDDASVHFSYLFVEGEGATVITRVTARETEFHRTLYQLGGGGEGETIALPTFLGDHGFTGLNYAYPPDSSAEVQYWCEATS